MRIASHWMATTLGMLAVVGCGKQPSPPGPTTTESRKTPNREGTDHDRIQGVWSIEAIDDGLNASKNKPPRGRVQFQGENMIVTLTQDDRGERKTYKLDPSKSPKWITLTQAANDPRLEPLVEAGIYNLEGDSLTIAWSPDLGSVKTPRPTEFKAGVGEVGRIGRSGSPPVTLWRLQWTDEAFFQPKGTGK